MQVRLDIKEVIMLEVAVEVEVETDEDCDDLGVRHHTLATAFWGIRR